MNSNTVSLVNELYKLKLESFASVVELSEKQKLCIPGASINEECVEALRELNIII